MAPSMRDSIDGRYVRLDVVRAFAIIMVVALHSVHEYMDESVYQAVHPYICTPVLFFMTSGALIFPVRSGRAFVRRRMWALLPAFAFWTVVYLLMDYYLTPHQDVSIGHRLLYCLYTPTWGTGWFVLAMVGLYLFAPFLSPWLATARRRSIEYFLLLWLAAGTLPWVSAQTAILDDGGGVFTGFYGCMGYMVAGYYLTRWPVFTRSCRWQLCFWTLVFAAAVPLTLKMGIVATRWGYYDAVTSLSGVNVIVIQTALFALLTSLPTPRGVFARLCISLSRCSYGIYLVHIAILHYLLRLADIDLGVATNGLLSFIASYLLTLAWRKIIRNVKFRMRCAEK